VKVRMSNRPTHHKPPFPLSPRLLFLAPTTQFYILVTLHSVFQRSRGGREGFGIVFAYSLLFPVFFWGYDFLFKPYSAERQGWGDQQPSLCSVVSPPFPRTLPGLRIILGSGGIGESSARHHLGFFFFLAVGCDECSDIFIMASFSLFPCTLYPFFFQ